MFLRSLRARGLTAVDLALVLAIAATGLSVTTPSLQRALRRARLCGAVQEVYSLVLATRKEAIQRKQHVVLFVDLNQRRIVTWADKPPYNYLQDSDEPTIDAYSIPSFVFFRSPVSG